jgi:hypothetical protein
MDEIETQRSNKGIKRMHLREFVMSEFTFTRVLRNTQKHKIFIQMIFESSNSAILKLLCCFPYAIIQRTNSGPCPR